MASGDAPPPERHGSSHAPGTVDHSARVPAVEGLVWGEVRSREVPRAPGSATTSMCRGSGRALPLLAGGLDGCAVIPAVGRTESPGTGISRAAVVQATGDGDDTLMQDAGDTPSAVLRPEKTCFVAVQRWRPRRDCVSQRLDEWGIPKSSFACFDVVWVKLEAQL